ncbi:MAG TPA: lipopolysaccharide biosynthesis protein [Lacipirellula sp.]
MPTKATPAQPRRSLQADTLAASVILLLTVTVVQRTVGFGRGLLFCRWMSPEALGEWELAYSFLMLAAPLAVLGVPGSFGRYAEHYRQRGHLKTFLRRAGVWTLVCTGAAVAAIECFAPHLSQLVFGSGEFAGSVRIIGACLAAIILQHTLTALLTALRLYRIVSAMNFVQSVLFAAISLGLLWRRPEMLSILYGYTFACIFATLAATLWAWPALFHLEQPPDRLAHSEFWGKLLRFAFFVWATNLMTHLFAVVDRYMLVHYAGMSPEEALDQIGHYHASRLVPLLMVSIAEMLTGMVMPHLSHDWEAGRRVEVGSRLNLAIKLTALGMLLFGACVIIAGPLLFNVVLEGRYDLGLSVLPWAVAGCVWYSIYLIAQNYLWCAEKNWLQMVPLALGLLTTVVLNLALLPHFGLYGCSMAAAAGALACLFATLTLNRRHGLAIDRGVWILALTPAALGLGVWPATVIAMVLVAASLTTDVVLTTSERQQLWKFALGVLARFVPLRPRPAVST